jgi:tRNA-dihydrouridine synthase A
MMTTDRKISIAPMMDCTDRHYRQLVRCLSQKTWLYSEMVTAGAVIHGDRDYLLGYHETQHPIVLQLGGSDPEQMAQAARVGESYGYDEININVGCPSNRVKSGNFGACLMKQPDLVAQCVQRMRAAVSVPITVKSRIGVDDLDHYDFLKDFVEKVQRAGCRHLLVHARKAWLSGLSPKENREIPPLCYETVYRLKQDFPGLHIGINGGIKTLDEAAEHLRHVDEVMIGREAYSNPYLLAAVDARFHQGASALSLHEVVARYRNYLVDELANGVRLRPLIKPLIGLFQGVAGAKAWRRTLSEGAGRSAAGAELVDEALACLQA